MLLQQPSGPPSWGSVPSHHPQPPPRYSEPPRGAVCPLIILKHHQGIVNPLVGQCALSSSSTTTKV